MCEEHPDSTNYWPLFSSSIKRHSQVEVGSWEEVTCKRFTNAKRFLRFPTIRRVRCLVSTPFILPTLQQLWLKKFGSLMRDNITNFYSNNNVSFPPVCKTSTGQFFTQKCSKMLCGLFNLCCTKTQNVDGKRYQQNILLNFDEKDLKMRHFSSF